MIERHAHELLAEAYARPPLEVFDHAQRLDGDEAERLDAAKQAADALVQVRLAKYADAGRTQLELTNAGRYWALHGGYLAFLKETPPGPGSGRQRDPELESIRLNYMKLRLNTFWWSFGLAVASFVISLVSLAVVFFFGDRFFR